MTRVRIDLAYDGADFAGFASQADQITVQGSLVAALRRLTGKTLDTAGAGRTDRGVHALGQVLHADLDPGVRRMAVFLEDLDASRHRLQRMVGDAITIWGIGVVEDDFHARFSATHRVYRYRLSDEHLIDPVRRRNRWHVGHGLEVAPMHTAAQDLVGLHDWTSFCREGQSDTLLRRIESVDVIRTDHDDIHVRLRGRSFCHQQVRAIVGCLAVIGRGEREPTWLVEVLVAQDRALAAAVAPSRGLTLESVGYPVPWQDSPLRPDAAAAAETDPDLEPAIRSAETSGSG